MFSQQLYLCNADKTYMCMHTSEAKSSYMDLDMDMDMDMDTMDNKLVYIGRVFVGGVDV